MAYQYATTFADRDLFARLNRAGLTYAEIAQQCGWKLETVRKHCGAFHREGAAALQPHVVGPRRQGCLSTFDPVVRFAALRLKRRHLAWGPAVILDALRQRPSARERRLPQVSQLAAYYQQFGARLVHSPDAICNCPRRSTRRPLRATVWSFNWTCKSGW